MKIGAIIQARMGSTRLPSKVMLDLCGKPVIEHVVGRTKLCSLLDEVIIATTTLKHDDVLEEFADRSDINCFRGSEDNVLSRYYLAALNFKLDTVVRITSDCPVIDPFIITSMIDMFINNKYEMVTNAGTDPSKRTYPRGLDTEVFSFSALENSYENAKEQYHKEHVTPYIYENCKSIYYYKNDIDYSRYRWTLDTEEDYRLISAIYLHLYHGKHDFFLNDIINLFKINPSLELINKNIEQKKFK